VGREEGLRFSPVSHGKDRRRRGSRKRVVTDDFTGSEEKVGLGDTESRIRIPPLERERKRYCYREDTTPTVCDGASLFCRSFLSLLYLLFLRVSCC
jgi:hypothetical protein